MSWQLLFRLWLHVTKCRFSRHFHTPPTSILFFVEQTPLRPQINLFVTNPMWMSCLTTTHQPALMPSSWIAPRRQLSWDTTILMLPPHAKCCFKQLFPSPLGVISRIAWAELSVTANSGLSISVPISWVTQDNHAAAANVVSHDIPIPTPTNTLFFVEQTHGAVLPANWDCRVSRHLPVAAPALVPVP